MAEEAYCVKCRATREMKNGRAETMQNGRRAMRGECAVCGTKIMRFLPSAP